MEGLMSLIKPKGCCIDAAQIFCLDNRCVFLDFNSTALLDPRFPCLVNLFGLTLFYKNNFLPVCCKSYKELNIGIHSFLISLLVSYIYIYNY